MAHHLSFAEAAARGRRHRLSPLPLLGFYELLHEGAEDTAARLR